MERPERRKKPRVCLECGADTGHYLCDRCLAERMGKLNRAVERVMEEADG